MSTPWGRAADFESRAALDDVTDDEIHLSRLSGMSPQDIANILIFSVNEALLIVVRCPKRAARYFHGKYPPKTMATGIKYPSIKSSAEDGLVHLPNGKKQVSDYDLMCIYRLSGPSKYEKIFFSGIDLEKGKRSPLSPEATALLRKVNGDLKSRFQHGAQDDFQSKVHPGVKSSRDGSPPDRFVAFNVGRSEYMANPAAAKKFYAKYGLA